LDHQVQCSLYLHKDEKNYHYIF